MKYVGCTYLEQICPCGDKAFQSAQCATIGSVRIVYNSRLFPLLTDEAYPLITMGDTYIVNELVNEIMDNKKKPIKH